MSVLKRSELEQSSLSDLHVLASEFGLDGYRRLRKEQLIDQLLGESGGSDAELEADSPQRDSAPAEPAEDEDEPEAEEEEADDEDEPEAEEEKDLREGTLDVLPNGSGFLRADPFAHGKEDVYVSPAQIRRCELRAGDKIAGPVRPPRRSERYPSLLRVEQVNGGDAEPPTERRQFEELTAVWPTEKLPSPSSVSAFPFGRGSRVAVGGAPGAGATELIREVATTLKESGNLTIVLAGALPEELTDWRRAFEGVPLAGGSFDRPLEEQAQAAEVAVELAKRVAERGEHAVVVIDSLDALPPTAARRVFGAARNTEEAGSLTIVAATGTAAELQRLATTRIVMEAGRPVEAQSGTSHAESLG